MRILKPTQLALGQRPFRAGARSYVTLSVIASLALDEAQTVLLEPTLWQKVMAALPPGFPLDEGHPKPRGEVLVSGSAFATGAKPASGVPVRVRLGAMDKALWVVGDRTWGANGASAPVPFREMPIDYARAFGGPGFADNPLGKGLVAAADGRIHLPNVEHPAHRVRAPADRPHPAGFGPYGAGWAPRMRHAGTHDERWLSRHFPAHPEDTSLAMFHSAPEDQRLEEGFFHGDEAYRVEGMHPDRAVIEGALPGLAARLLVRWRAGDEIEDLRPSLDTVHVFPGAGMVVLVFRALCQLDASRATSPDLVLAALERTAARRPRAAYEAVMAKRLDPKWGDLASLRDADLLPEGHAFESLVDLDAGASPSLLRDNMRKRAERELDAGREKLRAKGIDPDAHGVPSSLPEEPSTKLDDLPAVFEDLDRQRDEALALAEAKRTKADADLRRTCAAHGLDYDAHVAKSRAEGAGPPKFRAADHIQRLCETAELFRNAGLDTAAIDAQLASPRLARRLAEAERAVHDVYRRAAHHMDPARTRDAVASAPMRAALLDAIARGEPLDQRDFTGVDLRGLDLSRVDLSGIYLEAASLAGCDLTGCKLTGAVLARADLCGADLSDADLGGANLGGANLGGAKLDRARLVEAVLHGADLTRASVRGADLAKADLMEARFAETDMAGASAIGMTLLGVDLAGLKAAGADLSDSNFIDANVTGADFSGARLDKATFVNVRGDRARFEGADLRRAVFALGCSFAGADLRGARLDGCNLSGAVLRGADLSRAALDGGNLSACDMQGAKLYRVVARGARFSGADLRDADLTSANLMRATFHETRLAGATFKGANLFRADFDEVLGDASTSFEDALVEEVRVVARGGGLTRIAS